MEDRPYQSRSVSFILPRRRAFVVAPAGSGKTVIAAKAASQKVGEFERVKWLANTKEQCEQARIACARFKWANPVEIDVHCVAGQPDVSGADLVVLDEAHHLPARTWWNTVYDLSCPIWGFSATPWTGDWERDGVLKAFFGEENIITIPRSEVMAGGSITKGQVVLHDLDQPGEFDAAIDALAEIETEIRFKRFPQIPKDEHLRRCRWQFTIEALQANANRNSMIVHIAINETRSVLILVASIEHGQRLQERIPGSVIVYSKIGQKKRRAAIEAFRSGALRVMIATSLADEGLDVPRAAVLILAAGGRSAGKVEQRAGRVMRPHEGKEFGVVHDFKDAGAGIAHNQFKARARTYKRLGYQFQ